MQPTKQSQTIKDIADTLVAALLDEGFIIQRYDSYSSNSIYLKLDYGTCNSIRISDHQGKKHLKYRYNIGTFIDQYREEKDTYIRYYYRADKIKNLIKRIKKDKDIKMTRYKERYTLFMYKNKRDKNQSKGFWKQAYLVTK